jgi:uncharacterized membrane protein
VAILVLLTITAAVSQSPDCQRGPRTHLTRPSTRLATNVLSWTIALMVFALHDALEYYRHTGGPQSLAEVLDFLRDQNLDCWDSRPR